MRQLISFAVKRIHGANAIEANDGVDALKKLLSNKIDLILSDINMPVMDGIKLISLVRGNPAYKDIPIIVITTEGAEEDRRRAFSVGADAFIPKPIQTQELIKLANKLLKKS